MLGNVNFLKKLYHERDSIPNTKTKPFLSIYKLKIPSVSSKIQTNCSASICTCLNSMRQEITHCLLSSFSCFCSHPNTDFRYAHFE